MLPLNLESPIHEIKGIGLKKKEFLNSNQITKLGDLLTHFPRRYIDKNITEIPAILTSGQLITTVVEIIDFYIVYGKRKRLIIGAKTKNNRRINLVFFKGIPYFKNLLKPQTITAISGNLDHFRGLQMIHPECEILSDEANLIHSGGIIPMYSSNEQLSENGFDSKGFRRTIHKIFQQDLEIKEILPTAILQKYHFLHRKKSFQEIHFPSNEEVLQQAIQRFKYEEIFFFFLTLENQKNQRKKIKRVFKPIEKSTIHQKIINHLPFQLTGDQKMALDQLQKLSLKEEPMVVLLQGDVGSGKTLVALLTAVRYIEKDIQVCFLAPTEILVRQHFNNIFQFLGNLPFIQIETLLGAEKKKDRLEKLQRLKSGDIKLVIGTHSLFQSDIEFQSLGLVIIDEQHKFGVEQRETLIQKGKNPDILAMTATPIPRTLALSLYGDSEQILIKNKPKGRQEIQTLWLKEEKRKGLYNSVRKYLKQGRQCYVVYPLVEESEKMDLASCVESYEIWKEVFQDYRVDLLHGKMKNQEKAEKMLHFQKNETQILITTTVIEVGIDVPNATIMVIENAERFGISQLHQLRGRVGRGKYESFCVLMTKGTISEDGIERLKALVNSNDGFYLAEKDLEIRGPGEMLGIKQSGLPNFKLLNLQYDKKIIENCKNDIPKLEIETVMQQLKTYNPFYNHFIEKKN